MAYINGKKKVGWSSKQASNSPFTKRYDVSPQTTNLRLHLSVNIPVAETSSILCVPPTPWPVGVEVTCILAESWSWCLSGWWCKNLWFQALIFFRLPGIEFSRWWQLKYSWNFHPDFVGKWSNLTCAYFSNGLVQMGWSWCSLFFFGGKRWRCMCVKLAVWKCGQKLLSIKPTWCYNLTCVLFCCTFPMPMLAQQPKTVKGYLSLLSLSNFRCNLFVDWSGVLFLGILSIEKTGK